MVDALRLSTLQPILSSETQWGAIAEAVWADVFGRLKTGDQCITEG